MDHEINSRSKTEEGVQKEQHVEENKLPSLSFSPCFKSSIPHRHEKERRYERHNEFWRWDVSDRKIDDNSNDEENAAHDEEHDTLTTYSFPELSLAFFHY